MNKIKFILRHNMIKTYHIHSTRLAKTLEQQLSLKHRLQKEP